VEHLGNPVDVCFGRPALPVTKQTYPQTYPQFLWKCFWIGRIAYWLAEFRGIDSSSTLVKILIDISPEHYDRILSEFTEESRMYAILKNGLVLHHFEAGNEFRTVEILCEKFHARMILAAAEVFCPEAAAEIEEAIRLSRTLH
jgi:hypothetical protein